MATHLLRTARSVKKVPNVNVVGVRQASSVPVSEHDLDRPIIGNREVVGAGMNTQLSYYDRMDWPLPAIRFRPNDAPGIQALREKEKGDWHKLTKEEKKALYRASFCQTLVETTAPDPYWKSIVGAGFFALGITGWIVMALKHFVFDPLPDSFSLEERQWQLQRVLDLELEPIEGIASNYDYEKGEWKKKSYYYR